MTCVVISDMIYDLTFVSATTYKASPINKEAMIKKLEMDGIEYKSKME